MPESVQLEQMVEKGYALQVCRLSDTPIGPKDRVLYARPDGGPILIARAPIRLEQALFQFNSEFAAAPLRRGGSS